MTDPDIAKESREGRQEVGKSDRRLQNGTRRKEGWSSKEEMD